MITSLHRSQRSLGIQGSGLYPFLGATLTKSGHGYYRARQEDVPGLVAALDAMVLVDATTTPNSEALFELERRAGQPPGGAASGVLHGLKSYQDGGGSDRAGVVVLGNPLVDAKVALLAAGSLQSAATQFTPSSQTWWVLQDPPGGWPDPSGPDPSSPAPSGPFLPGLQDMVRAVGKGLRVGGLVGAAIGVGVIVMAESRRAR